MCPDHSQIFAFQKYVNKKEIIYDRNFTFHYKAQHILIILQVAEFGHSVKGEKNIAMVQ